uniref:Uncharacterized protein n=1 Tax=Arion vulgaris TaxID=1028688 RepID=A0A0B6Z5S4_9EUPU
MDELEEAVLDCFKSVFARFKENDLVSGQPAQDQIKLFLDILEKQAKTFENTRFRILTRKNVESENASK